MFDATRFLQIIEGAAEAIDNLVQRLRRDSRHPAFEIRDERIVASRSFPDWSMELVRVSSGYLTARSEIEPVLPPEITPPVRALVLSMVSAMGGALHMPD